MNDDDAELHSEKGNEEFVAEQVGNCVSSM